MYFIMLGTYVDDLLVFLYKLKHSVLQLFGFFSPSLLKMFNLLNCV